MSDRDNTRQLVSGLPPWMPRDDDSGNYKFFDVIGEEFDRMDADIEAIDRATLVQKAQSIEELEQLATTVGATPKEGETLSKYRTRVMSELQALTSEGTIGDLIVNTAVLLGTSYDKVVFELLEPGYGTLKVPLTAVDALDISDAEFADILSRQAAAGYRIEITKSGTFTYTSAADYTPGESFPERGYGGLDINGDPKDTGGTYSGVL